MGWNTKYQGPEIDAALEKGKGLRVVNNGWIRLESSGATPTDLRNLRNPGNYLTSFWTGGPDLGTSTVTPLNVTVVTINGETYQYIDVAGLKYSRKLTNGTFEAWAIDQTAGAINPGPDAPANPVDGKTLWMDTTNAAAPVLKLFINGAWKEVIPESAMQASVYDASGRKTDIFAYIDKAIADASIGTIGIDFETHINDTIIHVTSSDKQKWNNAADLDDVNAAAAAMQGSLTTQITDTVGADMSKVEALTTAVNDLGLELDGHTADTTIHPSTEKQTEWDNKADSDHTHYLDGNVTVDTDHVQGEINSSLLPYDVKERAYIVSSEDERIALTKNPLHNGDVVCVETDAGNVWYFVIDDSYLGNTEIGPWTESTISSEDRYWQSVCYGKDKYVAVANSNYIAYSTDGLTWVESTVGSEDLQWCVVCYGNDKFVTLSDNYALIAYSLDGITWTESAITYIRFWSSICYGKDKFVAVAGGGIAGYSLDGITWTIQGIGNDPALSLLISVCYGKDKFVAVIQSSLLAVYSSDGITWSQSTISDMKYNWWSICYGKDKFVAVHESSYYAYSLDGITWNENTISDTSRNWMSVCYGKDKFVAVSWYNNYSAYSSDGITWIENVISDTTRYWWAVCYGNGKFVTVCGGVYNTSNYVASTAFSPLAEKAFKQVSSGSGSLDWDQITNTPTTAEGYGITDAASKEMLDTAAAAITEIQENLPDTTDFSTIAASQLTYNTVEAGLEVLDAAFTSLDEVIEKLQAVAQ